MSREPHQELPAPRRSYEFGPFRLDEVERHLLRGDAEIPLTTKATEVLLLLVRSGGRTVTKEEFMREVWRDTFVEEANLTDNVSTLRQILGDDPRNPTYIKTVPKVGYRFLPPISINEPALVIHERSRAHLVIEEETPDPTPVATKRVSRRTLAVAGALGVAVLAVLFARHGMGFLSRNENSQAPPVLSTITSYADQEWGPALSPDGKFVVFAGFAEKDPDSIPLYVRQVDVGTPLKLTSVVGRDSAPAWSPDGRHIAFVRKTSDASRSGIFLIPAFGGAERQLLASEQIGFLSWSPDGRTLACAIKPSPNAPYAISLLDVQNGKTHTLTHPKSDSAGDYYVAFSPDGKRVAFARLGLIYSGGDLFVVELAGGEPRRITFDDHRISGLAWDPGQDVLIYSSVRNDRKILWKVPSSGGAPMPLDPTVENAFDPSVSRDGGTLAYTRLTSDASIYRLDLTSKAAVPKPMLASSGNETFPRFSADGRKVAFESDRSGSDEIWLADSDGSNPAPLTSRGREGATHPAWSPDGRQIAFVTRDAAISEIHIISATGGRPHRLTSHSNATTPSWSRDGRSVYFSTNRDGNWQVWRVPAAGGPATQVTRHGGYESAESSDGRFLFYTKYGYGTVGLFRQPLPSGEEEMIYPFFQTFSFGDWALTDRGLYVIERFDRPDAKTVLPAKNPAIRYFDFASRTTTDIAPLFNPGGDPGLSVVDGGRALVFSVSRAKHDLMIIRNYR